MGIFALAPSMGPTLGPFCSGFLGENQGWRWVMGLLAIFAGVMWIMGAIFVPETYTPVILRKRVATLSKMTGKVYTLEADRESGPPSLKTLLPASLLRPWILLFLEPIVLLLSLYIAIIYGTFSAHADSLMNNADLFQEPSTSCSAPILLSSRRYVAGLKVLVAFHSLVWLSV